MRELDVLEDRAIALTRKLFPHGEGMPNEHRLPKESMLERIGNVQIKAEQLRATIPQFDQLQRGYDDNRKLLDMHTSISSLDGTSQLGDYLKMALVLSSEQEIDQISKEASRLIELQSYIDTPQVQPKDVQKLSEIEENHANEVQKALLLHARVQQTLKIYQEMVMSEKCCRYNSILEQIEQAGQ